MTYTSPSPPIIPVQTPEIDGLAQVPDLNARAAVEVGDGAGHLQDTVVGTGGEPQSIACFRISCPVASLWQ